MYAAIAKAAFKTQLVHRYQILATLLGLTISIFAKASVWDAIFSGSTNSDDISLDDMITYAIISGLVASLWDWRLLLNGIVGVISSGQIGSYLTRPVGFPIFLLSQEIGLFAFRFLTLILPAALIVVSLYGLQTPRDLLSLGMFVVYCCISLSILFLIALFAGLLALRHLSAFSLEWLLHGAFAILSGSFVPLWFFPSAVSDVLHYLPFAFIGYFPTAVFLEKMTPYESVLYAAVGISWVCVLAAAVNFLWQKTIARIVIQGG